MFDLCRMYYNNNDEWFTTFCDINRFQYDYELWFMIYWQQLNLHSKIDVKKYIFILFIWSNDSFRTILCALFVYIPIFYHCQSWPHHLREWFRTTTEYTNTLLSDIDILRRHAWIRFLSNELTYDYVRHKFLWKTNWFSFSIYNINMCGLNAN